MLSCELTSVPRYSESPDGEPWLPPKKMRMLGASVDTLRIAEYSRYEAFSSVEKFEVQSLNSWAT
ncbi:hypothetical protein D3C75_1380090 [compost metagenome]